MIRNKDRVVRGSGKGEKETGIRSDDWLGGFAGQGKQTMWLLIWKQWMSRMYKTHTGWADEKRGGYTHL